LPVTALAFVAKTAPGRGAQVIAGVRRSQNEMRNGYMAAILIMLSMPVLASPPHTCSDFAVLSSVRDDGTELGLFLSKEIVSTPSWVPKGDEPPLPVGKALSIALEWGRKTYTRFDSVDVESIDLHRYGCSDLRDKWFYVVNFRPYIDGAAIYSSAHFAAVLMNGQVVAPRVTQASTPSNKTMEPTR